MADPRPGTIILDRVSKRYRLGSLGTLRGVVSDLVARRRGAEGRDGRVLWALRDVSLRVEPGECLGLIGPNGAGKTTVLRLVSRITVPTSGRVRVAGRTSSLIELGAGFHPELTGRENILLNGAILGLKRRELARRLDAIVAFSGLERFLDTPVKRYSSGMYVRLAFAIAAHVEPQVLLVDEVLAVGDAQFREQCIERMGRLREQGTTLLFVSHNMHLVREVCQRAVLLAEGAIGAEGRPEDVIAAYADYVLSRTPAVATPGAPPESLTGHFAVVLDSIDVSADGMIGGGPALRSGSGARLLIAYRSREPLSIGRVVVRLVRRDGLVCCLLDSAASRDGDGRSMRLGSSGRLEVAVESLALVPGRYRADVTLTDTSDAMVVASGQSEWFAIVQDGWAVSEGVFVPRATFTHVDGRSGADRGW